MHGPWQMAANGLEDCRVLRGRSDFHLHGLLGFSVQKQGCHDKPIHPDPTGGKKRHSLFWSLCLKGNPLQRKEGTACLGITSFALHLLKPRPNPKVWRDL